MSKLPKFFGYSLDKLSSPWKTAIETYAKNGAVKVYGALYRPFVKSESN